MAVTLSKYGSSINRLLCHLVGLSTDTKPIGTYTDKSGKVFLLENGSSFEEMDTDKKYLYDAENQTWNLADSGGGGGSATLIEKSITENGEYNASDDNADGYKKVTVDVAGGGYTLKAIPIPNIYLTGTSGSVYSPVSEGVFDIMIGYNNTDAYGNTAYLSQPASRINITTYDAGSGTIYFTPAETFDGFYQGDNKMSLYGDDITTGDGYAYKADVDRTSQYPNRVTITKYSAGSQVIPNT